MYVRMDDEVRRHVETCLAERYPQLTVTVGGARIVDGKGIAVYDVSLSDPGAPPGADELLAIEELFLVCDVKLAALVKGAPDVQRVEVKHPRLAVRRDRAGRWNVAALAPKQPALMKLPQVVIRGGALSLSDDALGEVQPLSLRDIQLTMTPDGTPTAANGVSVRIDGAVGGAQAKRVEIHATAGGPPWQGTATIAVDELQIDEALMTWIRALAPPRLRSARLAGVLGGKLSLNWANLHGPPQVHGQVALENGRIDDPRLPAPMTELAGRLTIDGDEQRLEDLHGKCGAAMVAASLNRTGWGLRSPLAVSARASNVPLDGALYRALVGAHGEGLDVAGVLREQWDKFQPRGVVDATLQGTFDGVTWTPTATLAGRGLSFESDKFASEAGAYRLTDGEGMIRCLPAAEGQPKRIEIDIVANGGGRPLHIVGQVIDPKPAAAGWIEITGEGLTVEQGMLDSIPNPVCRDVIGQLHPTGRFNVAWRLERLQPGAEPRTTLQLDLTDIGINYDHFRYPLQNIRGTISAVDNSWTFKQLVSGNRRPVHGDGSLRPLPDGRHELSLHLTAEKAPLDEALYEALTTEVQRVWSVLDPHGQIDLAADVFYRTGQPKPSIAVVIEPKKQMQLKPKFFPYLMEEVSGTVSYKDGQVELRDMRAVNDRTRIATNGSGHFWPEGHWQFQLSGLTADYLSAEPKLVSALPQKLRGLIDRLNPTGNFTLHDGLLNFRQNGSEIAPLEFKWDVQLDCHQTNLQCGIDLKYIDGSVRLAGESDGVRSFSKGELALESVTFQDIQFTNVQGPLWVNESKCLLGASATEQQQLPARPLTGNVYDGTLSGNAWVTFENLPQYQAEVRVRGADLRRLVVERFRKPGDYNGKIDANMIVAGKGSYLESLVGDGDVHIRDANLYELSLLASLLKMIRTGAADKTAFTQSDIAFQLQGRHIVLNRIDFLGDVVNLYGNGETDFDQNLNLKFSATIGAHDYRLPLVKSFVKQANERILQMYVNGTLSEPKVTTEAFPGIAQMVQQIRSDLKNPAQANEERQAERRRLATQQQSKMQ